ncbi:zinc metallochaperone AztD [Amycolatopsis arida]|nr:zinc metallochaperone AztD [Amycolatopsis arida]
MATTARATRRTRRAVAASAATAATLLLGACGSGASGSGQTGVEGTAAPPRPAVVDPVVATYDGGLYVLDGRTLDLVEDIPLDGFNRLNAAGDDRHVLVSTSTGFRVLDAVGATWTGIEFPAAEPGHVVRHDGRTVLFADGSGEVTSFDPAALGDGMPATEVYRTAEPHHGVAVELANGELVVTLGNEDSRPGILVLDEQRREIARDENCPGVHGEATAQGGAVVIGCETGVLVYAGGTITKVDSPTEYGRIGNQASIDASPITLGDYKQDEDADLERPRQVSLIDTRDHSLRLVDLDTSYSFRSLGRGPRGEGLVLGTDGHLHVIDPDSARVTRTIPVTDPWQEPLEWQRPRPTLFVRGGTAYVSTPARKEISAVDLASGEPTATVSLPEAPNELNGVIAH